MFRCSLSLNTCDKMPLHVGQADVGNNQNQQMYILTCGLLDVGLNTFLGKFHILYCNYSFTVLEITL